MKKGNNNIINKLNVELAEVQEMIDIETDEYVKKELQNSADEIKKQRASLESDHAKKSKRVVKEKAVKEPKEEESKEVDLSAKSQIFNGHKLKKVDGGWTLKVSETEQYCIKKKANGKWIIIHGKATETEFNSPSEAFAWLQKSVYKGTVKKLIQEKQAVAKKKKESQSKYNKETPTEKIENTLEKTSESVENRVDELKADGDSLTSKEASKMFSEIKDTIQHITDGIKATIERKKAVASFISQLAKEYGIKVDIKE